MAVKKIKIGASPSISPLAIYNNIGEQIARVNPDCSWSVIWDKVAEQHYTAPTRENYCAKAFSQVLMAAKDRFRPTAWEQESRWHYGEVAVRQIRYRYNENFDIALITRFGVAAGITADGAWSVNWTRVLRAAGEPMPLVDPWTEVASRAVVQMLVSAKDNFITVPWTYVDPTAE